MIIETSLNSLEAGDVLKKPYSKDEEKRLEAIWSDAREQHHQVMKKMQQEIEYTAAGLPLPPKSTSALTEPFRVAVNEAANNLENYLLTKPDDIVLSEVATAFEAAGGVVSEKMPENAVELQKVENEYSSLVPVDNPEEVQQKMGAYWVHATNHLENLIKSGGIANRSWLQENNPEALAELNPDVRSDKWSPLNKTDTNLIYFAKNHIPEYGDNIIAFRPQHISQKLYVQFDGGNSQGHFAGEVAVSDVLDNNQLPRTSENLSQLKMPIAEATIAVPRQSYKRICELFLTNGYPLDWISKHVFSYLKGKYYNPDELRQHGISLKGDSGAQRYGMWEGKIGVWKKYKETFSQKNEEISAFKVEQLKDTDPEVYYFGEVKSD